MPEHGGMARGPIGAAPALVISRTFPARQSRLPDIGDFVRRCLAESPLTRDGDRQVGETVFRALLEATGPAGAIRISFRIFPGHVEVDVLRSPDLAGEAAAATAPAAGRAAPGGPADPGPAASFADWMAQALRREGLTQEAAARRLGVSAKTVGRWVGGETEPRMRDLRRIQQVFGELPFP